MQYQRDPPPYPGHSQKQALFQPGFRLSFSGSEASTDVSMSSNENLSSLMRQDPQGEETQAYNTQYLELDSNSILARLGLPAVEVKSTNNGAFYVTGSCPQGANLNGNVVVSTGASKMPTAHCQYRHHYANASGCFTSSAQPIPGQYSTLPSVVTKSPITITDEAINQYLSTTSHCMLARDNNENPVQNMYNGLPDKGPPPASVASVAALDHSNLPPPPAYPGFMNYKQQLRRSYEMLEKPSAQGSRSQPDLTRYTQSQMKLFNIGNEDNDCRVINESEQKSNSNSSQDVAPLEAAKQDTAAIATRATQMVDLLSEENKRLRQELDGYHKKVSKLQKFEMEIQKVHESYENLVKKNQKREQLEKIMRSKMDMEIQKLKDANKEFKDQLEKALSKLTKRDSSLRDLDSETEIAKKDTIIAKLILQNKELAKSHERLDRDNETQRLTILEQGSRIEALDGALTNTQTSVLRLEDECRRKQSFAEHVSRLHKSLTSLKVECESNNSSPDFHKKSNSTQKQQSLINMSEKELKSILADKDEHILTLDAKIVDWEQKYFEESAVRQLAVDAASMPKEARIAMLEKSSIESEQKIAEARSERLKHIDEVYQANRRSAELEAKVKSLQGQIVEKDALVQLLQKHSFSTSNLSLLSSSTWNPRSTTLPSCVNSSHHSSQTDVVVEHTNPHNRSSSDGEDNPSQQASESVTLQKMLMGKSMTVTSGVKTSTTEKLSTCLWQV